MPEKMNEIKVDGSQNRVEGNQQFNDGTHYHYHGVPQQQKQIATVITDQMAWKLTKDFLRREDELDKVKEILREDEFVKLQVYGIGGMGKTSFCCHLFYDYKKALEKGNAPKDGVQHLGWISYNGNLKNSIFRHISSDLVSADDMEVYFQQAMQLFNQLGASLLLFIDNADDITAEDIELLSKCSCRVIVTLRYEIDEFDAYPLEKLAPETCMELYRKFSKDKNEADSDAIAQILEIADYHTQTVCLLARTQKESGYCAQELLDALRESGFSLKGILVEIKSVRLGEDFEDSFTEHMRKLFDIARIKEPKQIHVLRLFSLLAPNVPLARRTANEWFDSDSVGKLIRRGWLNTDDSGNVLIHPVIAATVQAKYPPDPERAARFINQLRHDLENSEGEGVKIQNKLLPHCVSAAKALHGTETNDFMWFLNEIGIIMRETGYYDSARPYFQLAMTLSEKINGKEHPATASTYNNIAIVYQVKGDYDKAMGYFEKALAIREKKLDPEHPATASTYNNIGLVYQDKGDNDKAMGYFEKALAIREKVLGSEDPDTAATYNNIGLVYQAKGDYGKALEYYKKDLAICKKEEHPDTASTYNNIASVYGYMGEYDKALAYYEKALAIREKVLGTEHPDTALTCHNIASVYQALDKNDKALEFCCKAYAICEKKLGKEHPDTANSYTNIAFISQAMGDYDKALEYYQKALAIKEKVLGTEHPGTALIYYDFGDLFRETGKLEEALNYTERARSIYEQKLGAEHPRTAKTYNLLARIHLMQGGAETALSFAEKAKDIYAKTGLTEHPDTAENFRTLAEICLARADIALAAEYAEQARLILEKKLGGVHRDTRKTYQVLADIYEADGDTEKSNAYRKKAEE